MLTFPNTKKTQNADKEAVFTLENHHQMVE